MPRIVQEPIGSPNCCAAHPHLRGIRERGYIDTGTELRSLDPHIYIAVETFDQWARELGYVTREGHAGLVEDLKVCRERIAELEDDLAEAQRTLDHIDAIESAGFRARKKAGRPPKSTPERNA